MWKRDQSATPSSAPRDKDKEAPRDQPAEPPRADSRPAEKLVLDLGKSMVIKGELSGSEDLTLCGQMEGSIKLPAHTLTIGPQADIKAEISAKTVMIMGAVTGNVTAGDKVEIHASGSVDGDIVSPRLVIAEGGSLHGKVQIPHTERGHAAQK